jgi:hypothetical protein
MPTSAILSKVLLIQSFKHLGGDVLYSTVLYHCLLDQVSKKQRICTQMSIFKDEIIGFRSLNVIAEAIQQFQ